MKQITEFAELCLADESIVWEVLCENGYGDLADCLTLCMDECGNVETVSDIRLDAVVNAQIVNVVSDRAYTSTKPIMVDTVGRFWIDADLIDEYFA